MSPQAPGGARGAAAAWPSDAPVPADPLEWRPQLAREQRGRPTIEDPVVEPAWSGHHVLAHIDAHEAGSASVRFIDALGEELTAEEPELAEALGRSLLASDAVIDGFLTDQATRGGEGATLALRADVSPLRSLISRSAEVDIHRRPDDHDHEIAFVAVDILRLDGQVLFDIPLLERKRLLESVLAVDELVRVSVYARPPLQPWLTSWKAVGFAGVLMKAANSRYRPHALTDEWTLVTTIGR